MMTDAERRVTERFEDTMRELLFFFLLGLSFIASPRIFVLDASRAEDVVAREGLAPADLFQYVADQR